MSAELAGILNSHYFLAIIFAGAFGDAFLFTAAFVFGEIFFIAAGYGAAHLGDYKIIAVALAGAFAGDLCSYLIGKHYGERILRRISRG